MATTPSKFRIPENIGLNRLASGLTAIVSLGENMIRNAQHSPAKPACAWDDSGLSVARSHVEPCRELSLLIDIGGSHTKVALVDADQHTRMLFDHPNEWFKPTSPSPDAPIRSFFSRLCHTIAHTIPSQLQSSIPLRVGVIWSNQLTSVPFKTKTTEGTTGLVTGRDCGSYRKGEWFLQGLSNGEDLGAYILDSFHKNHISCSVLLLGNDTVFTLFATPHANAGIVVSSGANCTLVGAGSRGHRTIFNSELGGLLMIPPELFSQGDQLYAETYSGNDIALEELCAGLWFSDVVSAHIHVLARRHEGEVLLPLAEALACGDLRLTNELISLLLRDPTQTPTELLNFPRTSIVAFSALAQALISRAGTLVGALCFLSVSSQIPQSPKRLIASLDSSMGRYMPGFFEAASETFRAFIPRKIEATLSLVQPERLESRAELTPPMIGLARALQQYHRNQEEAYARAACAE
jgi:hypothetical protein